MNTSIDRQLRRGQGAVLVLVVVVIGLIALIAGASTQQTFSTGRAFARIVDLRAVLEAADSSLCEAVVLVRASADGGAVTTACPDDWRRFLLDALDAPARAGVHGSVRPAETRRLLAVPGITLTIGDVRVEIVGPLGADHGVLELVVAVEGSRGPLAVRRVVRQRRAFTVENAGRPPVDRRAAVITVHADPIGTVIE